MSRGRRKGSRGSALVESALTLLVLLSVMIGIVDFGQFILLHATAAERVRSALRYGAVNPYSPTDIQNVVLYGSPAAGTQTAFGLSREMVEVMRQGAGTSEDRIVVTVKNYRFYVFSPMVAARLVGQPISGSIPYEYVSP